MKNVFLMRNSWIIKSYGGQIEKAEYVVNEDGLCLFTPPYSVDYIFCSDIQTFRITLTALPTLPVLYFANQKNVC